MSYADHAIHTYYLSTSFPGPHNDDPWFAYQTSVLRDLLTRLEVILQDEGVEEEIIHRVIRCLLYGSPHPPDALLRMEQQKILETALMNIPPVVELKFPPGWPT